MSPLYVKDFLLVALSLKGRKCESRAVSSAARMPLVTEGRDFVPLHLETSKSRKIHSIALRFLLIIPNAFRGQPIGKAELPITGKEEGEVIVFEVNGLPSSVQGGTRATQHRQGDKRRAELLTPVPVFMSILCICPETAGNQTGHKQRATCLLKKEKSTEEHSSQNAVH